MPVFGGSLKCSAIDLANNVLLITVDLREVEVQTHLLRLGPFLWELAVLQSCIEARTHRPYRRRTSWYRLMPRRATASRTPTCQRHSRPDAENVVQELGRMAAWAAGQGPPCFFVPTLCQQRWMTSFLSVRAVTTPWKPMAHRLNSTCSS